MVDPISIISLVEGSIGLILQCGSAIKSLNEIAAKYKQAELTLSCIIQEVDVIELAWKRIKDWFESYTDEAGDLELLERLDKSLKCGTNVISALQDDLLDYRSGRLGFMQRSRLSWNDEALRDHQYRIRGQVQAMSLLLQVIELPTSKARGKELQTAQNTFLESDESAYSIVPSSMSISSSARNSVLSLESADLIHHRWSFERDLLGARVYKRNYAKNLITSVHCPKASKAKDSAFTTLAKGGVSIVADNDLETSANGAAGAIGGDAPINNVELGLVLLSEETYKKSDGSVPCPWLDIVAIPGLIEEPLQTWTHPQTGHFWLRDSLPTAFISARIFTFHYPSYLLLSDEKAHIGLYAEKLLSDLKTVGAGKDNRELVFIAHSYGGLLVKKALVVAENDLRYSNIVRNTLLVYLFGTPEVFGSLTSFPPSFDLGDLVDLYLEGSGATTLKGNARRSLLETLKTNTGSLLQLTDAFKELEERQAKRSPRFMKVSIVDGRYAIMPEGQTVSVTIKSLSSYRLTLCLIQILDENVPPRNRLLWRSCGSHTKMCQFEGEKALAYSWLVIQIQISTLPSRSYRAMSIHPKT